MSGNIIRHTTNPKYLDNIIRLLPAPNILSPEETKKHYRLTLKIKDVFRKFIILIKRILHKHFNDNVWYNEARAHQLVKDYIDYINHPNCHAAFKAQHHKIVEIYNRLAHLSKGKGTWADGIDPALLAIFDADEQDLTSDLDLEDDFHELDELILTDIFIPDTLEEILEAPKFASKNRVLDAVGEAYVFSPIQNLRPPSIKQLFHFHADEFGNSSELEGLSRLEKKSTIEYLSHYLQSINQAKGLSSYSSELIEELDQVASPAYDSSAHLVDDDNHKITETQAVVSATQQKIKEAFLAQKPLLLMGGWTGQPSGHAIYYEILPQLNNPNKAKLRFYNTGAGIDNNHRQVREGYKLKYQTYCEWQEIDRDKLESPHFLEALYELNSYQNIPYSSDKSAYHEEDIYQGLKSFLQPKQEISGPSVEIDEHLLMNPQRTGICAWRSLMAFVRTKMDLNNYKRFKCDIKLQSLRDYVEAQSKPPTSLEWRLVRKSHQNLCRAIIKLHREKWVGDAYLKSVQENLKIVSTWIHQHKACCYQRSIKKVAFNYVPCAENKVVKNPSHLSLSLENTIHSQQIEQIAVQPCQYMIEAYNQVDLNQPVTLTPNLEKVISLSSQAWLNGEDLALHKGLIQTVSNLQLDEEFWKKTIQEQPQQAEMLVEQLGKIAQFFTKSCFTTPNASVIFSEKIYVFHKILHLQQLITQLGHPQSDWKTIDLRLNLGLNTDRNYLFLCFTDAKMQREMATILNSPGPTAESIAVGQNLTPSSSATKLELIYVKNSNPSLINILRTEYPTIIQEIAKSDPAFKNLPKFSQDAHICSSPLLPNWIKALYQTQFNCLYVTKNAVGILPNLDRKSDLEYTFEIEDRETVSTVKASLTGVDKTLLLQPELKKIIANKYLRYAGQYRKIITPPIQSFISFLLKNDCLKEKTLLNTSAKKVEVEMVDEEFRELAYLFTNSNFQIVETLEYFTKHPEKLQHSDYQTLFHILLFKTGLLDQNLQVEGFSNHLAQFVQKKYEQFLEKNDMTTVVFFLKMAHQLNGFCPEQPFFNRSYENLYLLLKDKSLEADAKSLIYAELIAQLSHKKSLNDEEILTLLTGTLYIEENQSHTQYAEDPDARKQVREAFILHAKQIQGILERGGPNQNLLNQILKIMRPDVQEDKVWEMKLKSGEFPFFSTKEGDHLFYPLLSKLISPQTKVLLPIKIRQNPIFCQLFPRIEQGFFYPGNIFGFTDRDGCLTRVHMHNDQLIIEQKLDPQSDEWWRFIPSSCFLKKGKKDVVKSLLGSRYLVHHYTHWQSLDTNNIYALDLQTRKRQYLITTNATQSSSLQIQEIKNLNNQAKLGKTSSLLTTFEDASYIHEWYHKQGHLKKIELPRFNLSFEPHPQDPNQLICNQFPQYTLNTTDPVPALGIHHHYILLQNSQGQRKVILPQQKFKSEEKKEVLLPAYVLNQALKSEQTHPQKMVVFDVDQKGKFFSHSLEANLYLVQILSTAQEYKKAAYYLKKLGEKLTDYTPAEQQILKDISSIQSVTGDRSGNGIILQLYADYLRIKNHFAHHHTTSKEDCCSLSNLYTLYLEHHPHATIFKLKPQEEIFILKTLLEENFNALHFLRLKELDPVAAQKTPLPSHSSIPPTPKEEPIDLKNFTVPYEFRRKINAIPPTLLTRPQESIKTNFVYYYDIARKGSDEEKQRLRQALHFLHIVDNGKHSNMAYFFETVLDHPHSFPDSLVQSNSFDYYEGYLAMTAWQTQVKEIAISHLSAKKRKSLSTPLQTQEDTLTQSLISLEEKQPLATSFNPYYQLPTLASFASICAASHCFQEIPNTNQEQILPILSHLLKSYKNEDPVQNTEVNRLINDLEAYQRKSPDPFYLLNQKGLNQIHDILNQDKNSDQATLKQLEENILSIANRSPSTEISILQNQLKKWAGLHKVLTLEEIIVNFARQDYKNLFQRNPALTETDVNLLAEMVGRFLLHATRQQQRQRAETILSQLQILNSKNQTESQEYKDLANQLAQEMLTNRSFNPTTRPAFLAFEYFAQILMRPLQVDKLEQFLAGGELNLVMEMIMGSGKSKVLLPLLGLMRANGKDLSMLIVPPALFETVSHDTQHILQNFDQSLRSIHFDRDTQFTTPSLQAILEDLQNIRDNQECLIMTSKSIQCLMLKYIDECTRHLEGPQKEQDFPIELKTMRKILSLLTVNGYPIIDEADFILNVLREISFSRGKRLTPEIDELQLVSELYHLLYQDESLRKLAKLESDPAPDQTAPIFTEQLYYQQIQQPLASALIDRLDKISFATSSLKNKIQAFTYNLTAQTRLDLMHYLCRDKQHIDSAQHFYDSLDPDIQNIVALAGEELSDLLPHTLTRICKEKYGLDDKTSEIFAIHYAATDVPNSGSYFINSHITMNYTFQTYMKIGISRELVEKQIQLLQEKAMREITSNGGKMSLKETLAYQAFTRIKGDVNIPLFKYQSTHIDDLVQHINKSSSTKLDFVTTIILPQLENFEEKISCNSYNTVSIFKKPTGFTGTLWNSLSMHHKLSPLSEVGTDTKTLAILLKNSRNTIISIQEGSTQSMLEQLKNQNVDYHLISDAGGYFKDKTNVEIAHAIARIKGKETVAYNKKNEQIITEGSAEFPFTQSDKKPEERNTFLDQIHTIGADIVQQRDAIGLVTIGRDMLLRDLLQSVWRLRKLDKSQTVRFVVSTEVEQIIRQKLALKAEEPISFDTILAFVIANQAAQQGRDNYKGLKQGLDNLHQMILLNVLLNEKLNPKARLQAFRNLRSTWIKQTALSSKELYGTLSKDQPSQVILEQNKQQQTAKIEQLFTKMPWLEQIGVTKQACLDEIDLIIQRMKDSLPAYLKTTAQKNDLDQTMEIAQETQKQNSLEVQESSQIEEIQLGAVEGYYRKEYSTLQEAIQALEQAYNPKSSHPVNIFEVSAVPVFPLKSYLENDPELRPYASAFDGINLTLNVLEWTSQKTGFALLGNHRTDLHHMLIQDSKIMLITQEDGNNLKQTDGKSLRSSPDYYNLTLGYNEGKRKLSVDQLFKVIKVKFLNGEAQFSPEELHLLKQWFKQQGASKMQTLYMDHILKGQSQKTRRYTDSPLQHLFAEMC